MDSKKIMEQMLEGIRDECPPAARDEDVQKAVENLAEMVVMYDKELKKQKVNYFVRRSLLVAFQTQTLGAALIMHSYAAGPN